MSYDSTLHGPFQAFTEFGRALGAGLGLNISPVTYTGTSMETGKRLRSGRVISPSPRKRIRTGPTFTPTTMAPSVMTTTRRTPYRHNLGTRPRYQCNKASHKTTLVNDTKDKERDSIRLVRIPYSADDTRFNTRNGRLVNVRGVRFQWICKWKDGQTTNEPIQVRWAIINPKINTGTPTDVSSNDNWWVSLNPGNEYAENYTSSSDHFDLMTRSINPKLYGVLKEGKFLLGPAETGSGDGRTTFKQQKMIQTYIKLNQQMKWGSNGTTEAENYPNANIHFVWWYCKKGTLEFTQSFTTEANIPIESRAQITTFFKTTNGLM